MVQLLCSDSVRERLERELAAVGIPVDGSGWVVAERGFDPPPGRPALVFDALDYPEVVRLLAAGAREPGEGPRTVLGQTADGYVVLMPREVRYLEADGDGIVACTASGRFRVKGTLQAFEAQWAPLGFVRVNKSQLVGLAHVREIVPWFNARFVLRLTGGDELEVSKMYAKRLRGALRM